MIVLALWSGILFHGLFGTFGLIFPPPDNVALQIGSSTTLSCTTDTYFVGWGFTAFGASTPIAISQSGCTNMPASPISDYTFRPTLNATGAGECNVTIVSAASRFAGEYICTEHVNSADLTKSAVVIVLESGPHCSVSATNTTQVEESTPVELSCSVSYNTTEYLRPQLTWRSQQSNTTSSNTYANSSITVTHPIPVISSDTCTLRFNPPTNPPANSATNVPSYTANCATPVVHPLYCPNRPTITGPTSGNVTNGTILTCTAAVSNPQANSYEWWLFAIRGNVTERIFKSNEETVEIIEEGVYVCNATNGLPGCTNTTTTFVITNGDNAQHCENNCGCFYYGCTNSDCSCGDGCSGCITLEVISISAAVAAVMLSFIWVYLCFNHPVNTRTATWWAHDPYSRCRCWKEACRCGATNHLI